MLMSPQVVYDNLTLLERVDVATSALYRQMAQDLLADPKVSFSWRQNIADRLNRANNVLTRSAVDGDDSY